MKVVIVGGGRVGAGLAERLIKTGHEPVVIEMDEERGSELISELDVSVVLGDGTTMGVLEDAGVEDADALVALTQNDESNLMVCKLAKSLNVPKVVSRVNKSKYVEMFEDVGADVTVDFISPTIGLYEKAVSGSEIYGLPSLNGEKVDAIEVSVIVFSKTDLTFLEGIC